MRLRIGNIELDFDQEGDLITVNNISLINKTNSQTYKPASHDTSDQIELLRKIGMSNKTLSMIANNVFGVRAEGKDLDRKFKEIETEMDQFFTKKIEDSVWVLFVAPIDVPIYGSNLCVVGLTDKAELVMLDISPKSPKEIFASLIKRGINSKDIKLGVLSFQFEDKKSFSAAFPKAQVALDWQEFHSITLGVEAKAKIKVAMGAETEKEALKFMSSVKNYPKELFTHFKFDQDLWRALKTTACIKRIEKDLKLKLRPNLTQSEENQHLIYIWSLARLQYYWRKVPVNSNQLTGLKYISN